MKELEGEVQELKNNISQLQLERSELITKVINRVICTGATPCLGNSSSGLKMNTWKSRLFPFLSYSDAGW